MVWYSHLLKNFPQFVVIHTVKSFSEVSEAEVDVFLELSCFFDAHWPDNIRLPWWGSDGKESACNVGDLGLIPGLGRSPGEGNGKPPVFLPGEFHGQRSLVGYSLWGYRK